jgi:hypothetical protein
MMHSRPTLLLLLLAAAFLGAQARADAPPQRYEIANGIVHDTRTQLRWQQATPPEPYSLEQAKSYCSSLDLNGTGFRLPTLRELASIVDISRSSPAIDPVAFPETKHELYWSSTVTQNWPAPGATTFYWGIYFDLGGSSSRNPDSAGTGYVRCVR